MSHASFRVRMPRLRSSLRVPDPRKPVARVPGVQRCGAPEAHVRFRGAVEHAGQVVWKLGSPDQRVRILRRPARPRRLQHELNARLRCVDFCFDWSVVSGFSRTSRSASRPTRHRNGRQSSRRSTPADESAIRSRRGISAGCRRSRTRGSSPWTAPRGSGSR